MYCVTESSKEASKQAQIHSLQAQQQLFHSWLTPEEHPRPPLTRPIGYVNWAKLVAPQGARSFQTTCVNLWNLADYKVLSTVLSSINQWVIYLFCCQAKIARETPHNCEKIQQLRKKAVAQQINEGLLQKIRLTKLLKIYLGNHLSKTRENDHDDNNIFNKSWLSKL